MVTSDRTKHAQAKKACSCGLGLAVGEPVAISHRLAARHAASTCPQDEVPATYDRPGPTLGGTADLARREACLTFRAGQA